MLYIVTVQSTHLNRWQVGTNLPGFADHAPPRARVPRHLKDHCLAHAAWMRMAEAGEENQESLPCPNCAEIVTRCNLKAHLEYVCQWVKESCRNLGCAAYVPRIRRQEHERRFCGATSAVRRRRRLARARVRSKYRRDWAQDAD